MGVRLHRNFKKKFRKLPRSVQQQFDKRVVMLVADLVFITIGTHAELYR